MATIRGCEEIGAIGRPSSGSPRACEYSFIVAHRLAHDEWHARIADQAATARLLAAARAAGGPDRTDARPRRISSAVALLRRTIEAVAIDAGRRRPSPAAPADRRLAGE